MEQKVSVRLVDDIVIVDCPKEMTMTYSNALYVELLKFYNQNRFSLIFNMQETRYISSFGISILIIAMKNSRENNGLAKLAALTPVVRKMIDSMDFNTLFEVYPDVETALSSFQKNHSGE